MKNKALIFTVLCFSGGALFFAYPPVSFSLFAKTEIHTHKLTSKDLEFSNSILKLLDENYVDIANVNIDKVIQNALQDTCESFQVNQKDFCEWNSQSNNFESAKSEVFSHLMLVTNEAYNVKKEAIIYRFFKNLVHELDDHGSTLTSQEYDELKFAVRGEFEGFGFSYTNWKGLVAIEEVVPGGSASQAGLTPGDVILKVNNVRLTGSENHQKKVFEKLKLKKQGVLELYRPKSNTLYSAYIMRKSVKIPHTVVETNKIPENVFFVKISNFINETAEDLAKVYKERKKVKNVDYVVLDLRNNPGGLLDAAVKVSNLFLSEKPILTVKTQDGFLTELTSHKPLIQEPCIVLINSGSASASEIVASALKHNKRALVVGERSYGKASIQSIFDLPDGGALKLTVAHYFGPHREEIQNKGITPHITLKPLNFSEAYAWTDLPIEKSKDVYRNYVPLKNENSSSRPLAVTFFLPFKGDEVLSPNFLSSIDNFQSDEKIYAENQVIFSIGDLLQKASQNRSDGFSSSSDFKMHLNVLQKNVFNQFYAALPSSFLADFIQKEIWKAPWPQKQSKTNPAEPFSSLVLSSLSLQKKNSAEIAEKNSLALVTVSEDDLFPYAFVSLKNKIPLKAPGPLYFLTSLLDKDYSLDFFSLNPTETKFDYKYSQQNNIDGRRAPFPRVQWSQIEDKKGVLQVYFKNSPISLDKASVIVTPCLFENTNKPQRKALKKTSLGSYYVEFPLNFEKVDTSIFRQDKHPLGSLLVTLQFENGAWDQTQHAADVFILDRKVSLATLNNKN